jgi:hypothetical protein
MTRIVARRDVQALPGQILVKLIAGGLAALSACGSPPAQPMPASEQSLRDIGNRNDNAALEGVEERARMRVEADMRAADRHDAASRNEEMKNANTIDNGQPLQRSQSNE